MDRRAPITADTADRLSRMCTDLADLVDAGVVDEADCRPTLDRLGAPTVDDGEVRATLADLEELLRRRGVPGPGTVPRGIPSSGQKGWPGYQPLPGVGFGRPIEVVYVCPGDLCSRTELPRSGSPVSVCAVWGRPLRPFRTDR
jgi:hypothetical protein